MVKVLSCLVKEPSMCPPGQPEAIILSELTELCEIHIKANTETLTFLIYLVEYDINFLGLPHTGWLRTAEIYCVYGSVGRKLGGAFVPALSEGL